METLENRTLTGVGAIAFSGNKLGEAMRGFMSRMGLPVAQKQTEGESCGRVKICLATTGRDAAWLNKPRVSLESVPAVKKALAEKLAKRVVTEVERMVRKSGQGNYRLVSIQFECVWLDGQMLVQAPAMKDIHILVGRTFGEGYRFMDDRSKLAKWLDGFDMKPSSRQAAA